MEEKVIKEALREINQKLDELKAYAFSIEGSKEHNSEQNEEFWFEYNLARDKNYFKGEYTDFKPIMKKGKTFWGLKPKK